VRGAQWRTLDSYVALAMLASPATLACRRRASDVAPPRVAPEPPGRTYRISLSRPARVGAREDLSLEAARVRHQVIRAQERVREADGRTEVRFEARLRLLAVGPRGESIRVEYTVRHCTATVDGVARELLAPGDVLELARAPRAADATLRVRGADVPSADRELLDLVLNLNSRTVDPDEEAGTTTPRALGEEWPMDSDVGVRNAIARGQLRAAPTHASGTMRLEALIPCGRARCAQLAVHTHMDGLSMAAPEGFALRASAMDLVASQQVPLDDVEPARLLWTSEQRITFAADGEVRGVHAETEMRTVITQRRESRAVDDAADAG
jgi:hypothetical protein